MPKDGQPQKLTMNDGHEWHAIDGHKGGQSSLLAINGASLDKSNTYDGKDSKDGQPPVIEVNLAD